ncbi:MAG: glycosyltransferase family 9 protein [Steroidobacteraceae bacterium]|nr:glycosyltransferase family 9 protein [Deltaproteobacteria bacterium]
MNWKLIRVIDAYMGIPLLFGISLVKKLVKQPSPHPDGVKRILLIKFWGIGNIFMLLPAIHSLSSAYPNATIDFLTLESNRDALTVISVVDNIVTINTRSLPLFIGSWMRAVSCLKNNNYDIIIDFEQFARFSALIAHQIEAPEIIGFDTLGQRRSSLFTCAVPYDNCVHVTRSFASLAAIVSCTPELPSNKSGLIVRSDVLSRGRAILDECGIRSDLICLVMHIGTSGNFQDRRWLPERYAELADRLVDAFQVRVVFTGLREEAFLIRETVSHIRSESAVVDLSGQLPFADYFALIASADLVISADTAAVHLASALDIPIVGLYGPNSPTLYGPWGKSGLAIYQQLDCSPCITNFNAKLHTCRHPAGRGACMQAIEVTDTFQKIQRYYFDPEAPCRLEKLDRNES